jgi:hypothetical protein
VFTVKFVVVMDDKHINPAVFPVIVAVTFGIEVKGELKVIVNDPEIVVSDPRKEPFIPIVEIFAAILSSPFIIVDGAGDNQFAEVVGVYEYIPMTFCHGSVV